MDRGKRQGGIDGRAAVRPTRAGASPARRRGPRSEAVARSGAPERAAREESRPASPASPPRADAISAPAAPPQGDGLSWWVIVFVICLAVPLVFFLGPVRLSIYRLVLVLMFVPLVLRWISGRAGGIVTCDILMLLGACWGAITLGKSEGMPAAIEPGGVLIIEMFGPYLLARCYIRTPEQFLQMTKLIAGMLLFLAPLALVESFTNINIAIVVTEAIWTSVWDVYTENRMGLFRAQGPFEHPILLGVFCASAISLCYYSLHKDRKTIWRFFSPALAVAATFFSLSSGPLLAAVIQFGLIAWDRIVATPHRWRLLIFLAITGYIALDLASDRTPFRVIIDYATFHHGSAYARVNIFNFGFASVMNHPFFGIGLGDWERPVWLSASVDNFWLLITMRHGLPTFFMLAGSAAYVFWRATSVYDLPEDAARYRTGLLIALSAIILAASAVHLWNAVFCWLMFLIGAGVWFFNEPPKRADPDPEAPGETAGGDARAPAARRTRRS